MRNKGQLHVGIGLLALILGLLSVFSGLASAKSCGRSKHGHSVGRSSARPSKPVQPRPVDRAHDPAAEELSICIANGEATGSTVALPAAGTVFHIQSVSVKSHLPAHQNATISYHLALLSNFVSAEQPESARPPASIGSDEKLVITAGRSSTAGSGTIDLCITGYFSDLVTLR